MSLMEHLTELRTRIIRALLAVLVGFIACFAFAEQIFRFLSQPLIDVLPEAEKQMVFTSLPEVFIVYLKVSIFAGIFLSSPVIFYQIWRFISPGLYAHEKKYMIPFVIISTLFFILGAVFTYYQVFPWGFKFFIKFSSDSIKPMISLNEYLKFATRLLLAFGAIFEMPILISFLARIGLVTPSFLRKQRKYAIVIMFTLAAILTPPDVITQLMMAGPMWVLYEISILAADFFKSKRDQKTST
ncbi:twin-arginine translocase subunit TatC [bacterium]|nr:twin-arginine translocase subunit TatC [candidate division CSSED10-310 bacterium]